MRQKLRQLGQRVVARLDGSLRARLVLPTALIAAVVLAGMVGAAVRIRAREDEHAQAEHVQLYATLAADALSNHMVELGKREMSYLLEDLRQHRQDLLDVHVLNPQGEVTISLDPSALGSTPWPAEALPAGGSITRRVGETTSVVRTLPNEPRCAECHGAVSQLNGYLDLRFSNSEVLQRTTRLATILIIAALIALVVLLGLSYVLLGREAVRPIQRLVAAMRRAEAGDTAVVADNGRPDEFGTAARSFDSMLSALRSSQAELERVHEERMIKADRFAMIGQMATGLAHEIKNPLAGLSGALELLAEEMTGSSHRAQMIAEMQHQVARLEAIMGGLLGFARPPRAQLRSTDVNSPLAKVLFLLDQQRRHGKVEVVSELASNLPSVRADAGQLEQVFLNICLNGYQAMGESGGRLTIRSFAEEGQVIVTIADTGPGIPPDVRPNIFTPFFTTRPNGTGLGLATSVRLLAQHGGLVEFDCPPHGGTVFRVSLPVEVAPPRPSSPGARAPASPSG